MMGWLLTSLALYSFLKSLKSFSFLLSFALFQQQASISQMLVGDPSVALDLASIVLFSISSQKFNS